MGETAEEDGMRFSREEVQKTIATSLAAAFGFVIALVWKEVVMGGIAIAGIDLTTAGDLVGWLVFAVVATVLTVVMVLLIIAISRWGGSS